MERFSKVGCWSASAGLGIPGPAFFCKCTDKENVRFLAAFRGRCRFFLLRAFLKTALRTPGGSQWGVRKRARGLASVMEKVNHKHVKKSFSDYWVGRGSDAVT